MSTRNVVQSTNYKLQEDNIEAEGILITQKGKVGNFE